MNKAVELITCLEGEIAKRDARIVGISTAYATELDELAGRNYALRMENAQLRAELAAIKTQEPVAWETPSGGIYRDKKVAEMGFRGESVCKVTPLFRYAAPVSEAKAQAWPQMLLVARKLKE